MYDNALACQLAEQDSSLPFTDFASVDTDTDLSTLKGKTEVIHGDSRIVDLPVDIDMVFTSPPYIGMIDYHEQHRYAYELLGLEKHEDKEIGSAKKGLSVKAKTDYISGIKEVLIHSRSHMAQKGIMVVVVNDKHDLYRLEEMGFQADRQSRTSCEQAHWKARQRFL